MDLIGKWRKETPQEIKDNYEPNLHYNWTGWSWIWNWLEEHEVHTIEFSGVNDGQRLSRKTCKQVAETLEKHWDELNADDQYWLKNHKDIWKYTLNFKQY